MLSGEGNENGEKTSIGLISKKATLHVQHIFLCISLPLFCETRETWNFQKLLSYTFYGGLVVRVLVHFCFSLPLIFTLVAASISHFFTAVTKFSCCSSNKKCLLCFLFLALAVCRFFLVELRWPVAYCLVFSVFLFLYNPNLLTWRII